MNCLHCTAETSNGLALCDLCQRKAELSLEFLPVYFHNLARWRPPARPNGSLGMSGQWLIQRGESEGSQIGHALARAANDLTTWARILSDQRDVEVPAEAETEAATVVLLCEWLTMHLTSVGTLEWAGRFVNDIARHERTLRELTERSVPGWYAGACGRRLTMETTCGAATHVVPGLTWVTCGACGSTTYARDHLHIIIDEARGWTARPMQLAGAVVALVDTEQSVPRLYERIKKWGQREQIATIRRLDAEGDPIGPKSHRLGDVLDMLATRGATPLDEAS